jgi:hypothetical protein
MLAGCEFHVRMWVRDGSISKPAPPSEPPNEVHVVWLRVMEGAWKLHKACGSSESAVRCAKAMRAYGETVVFRMSREEPKP